MELKNQKGLSAKSGIIHLLPLVLVGGLIVAVIGGILYFNQNSNKPLFSKEGKSSNPISKSLTEDKVKEEILFTFENPPGFDYREVRNGIVTIQNYDPSSSPERGYSAELDKGLQKISVRIIETDLGLEGLLTQTVESGKKSDIPTSVIQSEIVDMEVFSVLKLIIDYQIDSDNYPNYPLYYLQDSEGNTARISGGLDTESIDMPMDQILSTFEFVENKDINTENEINLEEEAKKYVIELKNIPSHLQNTVNARSFFNSNVMFFVTWKNENNTSNTDAVPTAIVKKVDDTWVLGTTELICEWLKEIEVDEANLAFYTSGTCTY